MPPRKRTEPAPAAPATEPCREHFPPEFPAWAAQLGCDSVGCEHGNWSRADFTGEQPPQEQGQGTSESDNEENED